VAGCRPKRLVCAARTKLSITGALCNSGSMGRRAAVTCGPITTPNSGLVCRRFGYAFQRRSRFRQRWRNPRAEAPSAAAFFLSFPST
jgi:hypothetical protein